MILERLPSPSHVGLTIIFLFLVFLFYVGIVLPTSWRLNASELLPVIYAGTQYGDAVPKNRVAQ